VHVADGFPLGNDQFIWIILKRQSA